jgi:hypothetical protein
VARRRRHQIDLLPLLDVFMVVLFVFATIQEQRLDVTTRDAERLEQRLAAADQALAAAAAREHETRRADDGRAAAALAEAQEQARQLRGELQSLRRAVADEQAQVSAELARKGLPEHTLERLQLLSRLLEKHSVLEIELAGRAGEDGLPVNRCCYRVDPMHDEWRACGQVPMIAEERERWLDDGANGLAEALRRTKGGNAMTIVRQDTEVSHGAASLLAEQLRSRFPDRTVDVQTAPVLAARCVE